MATSSNGVGVLLLDSPESVDVRISKAGFVSRLVDLRPGDPPHTVVLERDVVIEGIVVDERGLPRSSVAIRASSDSAGLFDVRLTLSDSGGRFSVPRERGSLLFVHARHDDEYADLIVGGRTDILPLTLVLQPMGVLRGTVLDSHGAPIPRAGVYAYRRGDSDAHVPASDTDPDGVFEVKVAPGGTYDVYVRKGGFVEYTSIWREGDEKTITLSPSGWVSGRVVGPNGQPITQFAAQLGFPNADGPVDLVGSVLTFAGQSTFDLRKFGCRSVLT